VPTSSAYSISDLARLSGVSVRTIRYYLSQGLLPAPGESGPGAHYAESHLDRLRLTKRLQEQHLPLAEIRSRLAQLTDDDVSTLAAASEERPASPTSALDYIRGVLGEERSPGAERGTSLLRRQAASPRPAVSEAIPISASSLPLPAQPPTQPQPPERSQWERLSLGPNVEIHVRRPLSRLEQKRVERLITIARQVLKEDTP
jgi:DNA-binding transcriptional MerR regulator